jgi:predicted aspartyl protease
VKVTRFDPDEPLIIVSGFVWGPHHGREVRLAVDTGAGETLLKPEILDAIGYSARQGEAMTTIQTAISSEPGYLLRVSRFRALGHEFNDVRVHAHDLAEGFEIDGLLGLGFLRHFNYEIRSAEGRILAERIVASP